MKTERVSEGDEWRGVSALDRGQGVGLTMIHDAGKERSHVAIYFRSKRSQHRGHKHTDPRVDLHSACLTNKEAKAARAEWARGVVWDDAGQTWGNRHALHQAWHTAHGNNGDDEDHHNDDSDDTSSWACAGCYTTQLTGTHSLNSIIETDSILPHFTDGEAEVQQDLCSWEVAGLERECWPSGARVCYLLIIPALSHRPCKLHSPSLPEFLNLLDSFKNLLKAVYLHFLKKILVFYKKKKNTDAQQHNLYMISKSQGDDHWPPKETLYKHL